MLKNLFITLFITFAISTTLTAQNDWQTIYEELLEEATDEEEMTTTQQELLFDELSHLHEHPLNINTATAEELSLLPFLNHTHIQAIQHYIQRNGPLLTTGELLLIDSLDYHTLRLLRHFIHATPPTEKKAENKRLTWKNLLQYGHHEAISRISLPLYKKAGYQHYSDKILAKYPNRKYLGEPFYHNLRYQYHFADKLSAGLVVEKDAGEPLFKGGFNGYDYISMHLMLTNIGRLKTLVVGDYRLHFGQGIVMNTGFNMGKTATLSSIGWGGRGIKRHLSVSEHTAFRGAAATLNLWHGIEATAFFSHRTMDATLDKNLLITSLKTDGLHRTPLEYSKHGNIRNTLYGGNLAIHHRGFHGGLTAVHNFFNRPLNPGEQLYKRYYPRGKKFTSVGLDYMYLHPRFHLAGETAIDQGGALATMNKLQVKLADRQTITLVQRYYAHHYTALWANSFSENSTLRNESGIYLGFDTPLWKHFQLSTYVDFCHFPWLKYLVSNSSYAGEGMVRIAYTPNENHRTTLRYRIKLKERDDTHHPARPLCLHIQHRLLAQHDYTPTPQVTWSTLINVTRLRFAGRAHQGGMLTQRITWQPSTLPLKLYGNLSYFHTDNYDTRISVYERALLHTFSFPSYYGHGLHLSTTCQWSISSPFTLLVHLSHTHYYDRSTIGSGTEQINQPHREDIGIQLRWKI